MEKIGDAFIKAGLITPKQLEEALAEQQKTSERLGDIIIKMGLVSPERIAPVLSQHLNIPLVNLKEIYKNISHDVIDCIPVELAYRFTVIPIKIEDKNIVVAMFDPLDLVAIDTLQLKTGRKIQPVVAVESEIINAIEYCYHNLPHMKQHVESFINLEVKEEKIEEEAEEQQFSASDQPVVQYVRSLIIQAVNSQASDILLQPKLKEAELRFRIDGVLHYIDPPPKSMLSAINSRVKILSGLDIAERRLPQDGRFKVKIGNSDLDIRTSTFPTIYGESLVMRLLDTAKPLLGLEKLGFENEDLKRYRAILKSSFGLILVTGPTGSGKTTTLYTSLSEFKSSKRNIVTLEDPIEYRLPFIQQSQVNSQIGFNFARGLRSILRQDPDIIMVGEIRDQETAEIAIHAALTGHLVFSTLHTNDAVGAPLRLLNMGIEPYLITSALIGVVAQRLVRVICRKCLEKYRIEEGVLDSMPFGSGMTNFVRGKGCPECFNTGYRGREGIFELLVPDDNIKDLILRRTSSEAIADAARKTGMKTLLNNGIAKLQAEITAPEEILRVSPKTEEE